MKKKTKRVRKKPPKKTKKQKPKSKKKDLDSTQEVPVFSIPDPYSLPPDEDGAYGFDPDD